MAAFGLVSARRFIDYIKPVRFVSGPRGYSWPSFEVGNTAAIKHGAHSPGKCTGAHVATPTVGAHVTVTGPYVLDRNHGWMEVHPAWSITAGNTTVASAPPRQTHRHKQQPRPRVACSTRTVPPHARPARYRSVAVNRATGRALIETAMASRASNDELSVPGEGVLGTRPRRPS